MSARRTSSRDGVAKYRIRDPFSAAGNVGSRITPGTGCVRVNDTEVKCNVAGITRIRVLAGDLDDTANLSTITIPVTLEGGTGADGLTGGTAGDTLTGGLNADRFSGGGGNDVLNARNDDVDTSFSCGENTGDTDTVNADATPDDPVTASATNCEVVNKA